MNGYVTAICFGALIGLMLGTALLIDNVPMAIILGYTAGIFNSVAHDILKESYG